MEFALSAPAALERVKAIPDPSLILILSDINMPGMTGLGLSMTHDVIVKQHRGSIEVDTEPGAFTEFIITLPRNKS